MSAPTWQYLIGAAVILVVFAALSALLNLDVTAADILFVLVFGGAGLLLGQWITNRQQDREE